jgi:hypothetical protein
MQIRSSIFIFLTLFSFTFLACSKTDPSGDGAITLALNTKVGDKQLITTDIDQHITTKVMEQDLKIDQRIQMDMTLMTKEVKGDSAFVIEGTFDRWAMKMDMNGAGMSNSAEFDTQDSTKNKGEMAPMMMGIFSKMVGQAFLMEMKKTGRVISSNIKEIMAKILPPGSSSAMTDDAMSTVPFPDHPVKPGDSWKGEIERDFTGKKAVFKADYTLKEVKDGVAHLGVVGEIVMKEDSKKLGTMTGTYSIATTTGMLKNGEIKMLIDMEIDSPAGTKQQMKMDQTITMTGKS